MLGFHMLSFFKLSVVVLGFFMLGCLRPVVILVFIMLDVMAP